MTQDKKGMETMPSTVIRREGAYVSAYPCVCVCAFVYCGEGVFVVTH